MNAISNFLEGTRNGFIGKLFKDGIVNFKLLFLGGLGILLLVLGGFLDTYQGSAKNGTVDIQKSAPALERTYEEALEGKLAYLLSQIKGAGNVSVKIMVENSGSIEHAKNIIRETKTVQEKDHSGGNRTTTEIKESEQILVSKEGGNDRPVMVRESKPVIKGVLIIAEGAQDSAVKSNLTKAIETGLGIPSYKITVLPHRK